MEQLPQINPLLGKVKSFFVTIWRSLKRFFGVIARGLKSFWSYLMIHMPFLAAFIERRLDNPAAIFIDLAVLVLSIYVIFGITGAILIYDKHSTSIFAEDLSLLYPLPAAKVSNNIIWAHEYIVRVRYIDTFDAQAAAKTAGAKPPTGAEIQNQVMEGLIQNQVLVLEAKKRNVTVTTQDVDTAYNQQLSQVPDLASQIKNLYGMNVPEFKEILAEQILKQKIETAALEQIRVSHILTTTLDAANQAEAAIKGGMSFSDAAKQYSQDASTKDNGGDLGFWTKGELAAQINQNFETTAFSLTVGQVSAPVQSQFGYHIITITSKTNTNYETFNDWYAGVLPNYKVTRFIK